MFGTSTNTAPTFGQTNSGFSFGTQPASNASGATVGANKFSFGQQSNNSGFGATNSFGQGLFGQAPSPAPAGQSLFGGGTTTAPNQSSFQSQPFMTGGGFSTQGSLFGSGGGQAPSGGLFGAMSKTAPPSLFGGTQQLGLTGQQVRQLPPGTLQAPTILRPAGPGIERRFHELWSEIAEYSSDGRLNPDARCVTLFYDTHDKPYLTKPDCVQDDLWKKFIRENPDPEKLSPVLVIGMDGLKNRLEMAQHFSTIFQEDTKKIAHRAELLLRSSQVNEVQLSELKARTSRLILRFLRVAKKIELLRAQHLPIHLEERRLLAKLRALDSDLSGPATRLEYIALKAKKKRHSIHTSSNEEQAASDTGTSSSSKASAHLLAALDLQTTGLRHLLTVSNTDHRDLKIMSSEIRKFRSNTF